MGNTGYWSFVDWVEDWKPNHGSPVSDPEEPLYLYSHMYAYGLLRAAYLYDALHLKDVSHCYLARYDRIKAAINQTAFIKNPDIIWFAVRSKNTANMHSFGQYFPAVSAERMQKI